MSPLSRYRKEMGKDFRWTRRKVFWMVLLPILVFMLVGQLQRVQPGRDSCDRGNVIRLSTVEANSLTQEFVRTAHVARRDSSLKERDSDPLQAKIDSAAARQYARIDRDFGELNEKLVASVQAVALEPGGIEANCKKAWPMPWPLNLLDL